MENNVFFVFRFHYFLKTTFFLALTNTIVFPGGLSPLFHGEGWKRGEEGGNAPPVGAHPPYAAYVGGVHACGQLLATSVRLAGGPTEEGASVLATHGGKTRPWPTENVGAN